MDRDYAFNLKLAAILLGLISVLGCVWTVVERSRSAYILENGVAVKGVVLDWRSTMTKRRIDRKRANLYDEEIFDVGYTYQGVRYHSLVALEEKRYERMIGKEIDLLVDPADPNQVVEAGRAGWLWKVIGSITAALGALAIGFGLWSRNIRKAGENEAEDLDTVLRNLR